MNIQTRKYPQRVLFSLENYEILVKHVTETVGFEEDGSFKILDSRIDTVAYLNRDDDTSSEDELTQNLINLYKEKFEGDKLL